MLEIKRSIIDLLILKFSNCQAVPETQDFVKGVPLILVYVGTDAKNSPLHAGSAYQNVGLYAASVGLNNVVRGYFDRNAAAKALQLLPNEQVIISQVVGWPELAH